MSRVEQLLKDMGVDPYLCVSFRMTPNEAWFELIDLEAPDTTVWVSKKISA